MDHSARHSHRTICSTIALGALLLQTLVLTAGPASALTVFDFAVFSSGGATTNTVGTPETRIGQSNIQVNGMVGSNEDVEIVGATVNGNVFAGRHLRTGSAATLGSSGSPVLVIANGDMDLNGNAGAGDYFGNFHSGSSSASATTMLLRSDLDITGNVFTKKDLEFNVNSGISISGNATVGGKVQNLKSNTIGGTTTEGSTAGLLSFTPLPMPVTHSFSAGVVDQTCLGSCTTITVLPGAWKHLNVGSSKKLFLQSGNYFFSEIDVDGGTEIYLDLSSGQPLNIFVVGNANFGQDHIIFVKGPGDSGYTDIAAHNKSIASLVYLEAHDGFDINSGSEWVGTVFAAVSEGDGAHEIHIGGGVHVWGALYAYDSLNIVEGTGKNPTQINFVRSYLTAQAPEPASLALLGTGLVALGVLARRRRAAAKV